MRMNVQLLKWKLEMLVPQAMLLYVRERENLALTSAERMDQVELLLTPAQENRLRQGFLSLEDYQEIVARLRRLTGAELQHVFHCPQAELVPFRRHRLGQALAVRMRAIS